MATFDIVIPAYNAAKYLRAAIDSVVAQDFADWRILLVNDGSTDATGAIAASYQAQLGEQLLILSQRNAGLPAARNAALRAATAGLVAILDADDVWLPCRLSRSLAAFANRPEVGLSYGLITRIDERGAKLDTFTGNLNHAAGRIASAIYRRRVELPCPTVTFRRECIEKIGYFDESMRATEDRDLWLRIAQRYEIAFIPEVIAYYRTSAHSMSTDMDRMLQAQLKFIAKHYREPGCGRISRRIATARAYKQRGEVFRERGRSWPAVRSALRACCMWPFAQENLRTAASLVRQALRSKRPELP